MTSARQEFGRLIATREEARAACAQAQAAYDAAQAEAAEAPLHRIVADRRTEIAGMSDNPAVQELLQRLAAIENDLDSIRPIGETEEMRQARVALAEANRRAEELGARYREAHLSAVEEAVAEAVEERLVPRLAETMRAIGVFEMIAEEIGALRSGDALAPAAQQTARSIQQLVADARASVAVRADREHAARFLAALERDPMAVLTMPAGPVLIERQEVPRMR